MNVLYLLVSLGKSLTFWQTMDEVIKIFVIVAAIAFAAYQNYAKKEKKKNKPSRKKMAKPATVHVEPDIIMAGQQNECVGQSVDNKLNKKRKGEGRKHRKLSEEAPQKDALSTAQQPESGTVEFAFMPEFKGKLSQYGITPDRRTPSGIRAAIIREKGTNGEREMAYSLYLAGFDVKDVTMTDLISGRETLEDVNMIVYCGGFSNSDVLGSAKGWAGGFLFNPKAKEALDKFYAREDTLSLGICNGCQLMMELGLINPEHKEKGKMLHNDSHKFESTFVGLTIPTNRSVMFGSLSGSKLGIWVAHGEGKFSLPYDEDKYNVVAKYSYDEYPGNPNGSDYSIAGLASADGRHLAMMPHLERAIFPWQNGCYPADRKNSDQVTPWIEAFVNARKWVEAKMK